MSNLPPPPPHCLTISYNFLSILFRFRQKLGENVTKKFLRTMIQEVDSDHSGEVDFDEFAIMLLGILKGKKTELSTFRDRFFANVDVHERKAWFQRVQDEYLEKKKNQQEAANRELRSGAAVGDKNLRNMRKLRRLENMHEPRCLCGCRSLVNDPDFELIDGKWKYIGSICTLS